MQTKNSLIILKEVWLKNVKVTGKAASCHQEVADEFPNAIKKITEEKGCLTEQVYNADNSVLFWGGNGTKNINQ